MKRLIFMTPRLTETRHYREQREGWLAAIVEVSTVLDGVIVCPWSHRELPDALERPTVGHTKPYIQRLLTEIRNCGLEVVWGRNLWPRKDDAQLGFSSAFDPAFYAATLANLEAERLRVGADHSWLYNEPHDVDDERRHYYTNRTIGWKYTGWRPADEQRATRAIQQATDQAPRATFAEPGFSLSTPGGKPHYSGVLGALGKIAVHRTYRLTDPTTYAVPFPELVECCGFWLSIDPTAAEFVAEYGEGVLSVEDYLAIDWDAWTARFPNLATTYIYTLAEEKRAVMLRLHEVAAKQRIARRSAD